MLRGGSRRCVLVRGLVGGVLYFCDGRADACLYFFFQAEDGIRDRSRQFLLNRSSDLKLLRRITRTENILHRNFTRRQVAIQNRVASNIGISQSTFSVKVLNLFSRSRRKTNKRKSKHSAMLRNKETRHRMFIGL